MRGDLCLIIGKYQQKQRGVLMQKNNKEVESTEVSQKDSRRTFLKKAVYAAPTVVALGALLKPTESEAGFGKPPSGPTNW